MGGDDLADRDDGAVRVGNLQTWGNGCRALKELKPIPYRKKAKYSRIIRN